MWKGIYPLTIGGIFLSILLLSIAPISDPDIWWHLATGKYILESGQIPRTDIFSHTVPGKEWVDHEWLSQVVFYQVYLWGGFAGVVLLKTAAVLVTFLFLFKRASLHTGKAATILTILTVILVSKDAWLERPMVFTFMLTSIFLYVLDQRGRKGPWTLPVLTLLWANLHGGFIVGILVIFIYAMGAALERGKELSAVLAASILASLVNPYTYRTLLYPLQYAHDTVHTQFILEWQSPHFHTFSMYEALILLTFVALALRKGISMTDLTLLIVFTHLSLFAVRNISIYGLVCAPIIVKYLESGVKDVFHDRRLDSWADKDLAAALKDRALPGFIYTLVALSFILFLYSYFQGPNPMGVSPSPLFPQGAVEYILEEHPQGQLYNHYGWGGYCIWTLYPEYRVFIDGRADMYGDFIYEYMKVHRLKEGWKETLDGYNVSLILIPRGSPLDTLLEDSTGWDSVYEDATAVVYTRGIRSEPT